MEFEEVEGVWECDDGSDAETEAQGVGREEVDWMAEARPATRENETHRDVTYAQQVSEAQSSCHLMSSWSKPK